MLGVMTQLELEVTDAYRLNEQVDLWPWEEVIERWDELVEEHRHFGFFWLPDRGVGGALQPRRRTSRTMADKCYVKIYDEAAPDQPDSSTEGRRMDRCYRIYPMVYDPNFHELEYFVPLELGPDALSAMRELMLRSLPDSIYPLEVRTVGPDDAYLSPNYKTATTAISVSGKPGTDYWDYLRSVDSLLTDFSAHGFTGESCTSSLPSGFTRCTPRPMRSSRRGGSSTPAGRSSTTICASCSRSGARPVSTPCSGERWRGEAL